MVNVKVMETVASEGMAIKVDFLSVKVSVFYVLIIYSKTM